MTIYQTNSAHEWNANVDVASGDLLTRGDYVSDAESYNVFAQTEHAAPTSTPGRVVTQPVRRELASPFGWHDTNGVAGAEFTSTQGNNVAGLRRDVDANNFSGRQFQCRADGGAASSSTSRSTWRRTPSTIVRPR